MNAPQAGGKGKRMEKKFTSGFALKATIAIAIVLALLMTYTIYLKAKPAGFSLLYFDQAEYSTGGYVAVLENSENAATNYSLQFFVDGTKARELTVALQDGEKAAYAVVDYAPAFVIPNSTVEVRALRPGREALAIYGTNRLQAKRDKPN